LATNSTDEPLPSWQADDEQKYHHLDYDDATIEGLMHYFKFQTYSELRWFLQCIRKTNP
jgi:hypothetical protein